MLTKEELLDKIGQFKLISSTIGTECLAFCANELIPLADRWEVFRVAPDKVHHSYYQTPNFIDTPYDELGLEKYQTFDVVEELDRYQKELDTEDKWSKWIENGWGQKEMDEAKNFYMTKFIGSWEYDW